MRQDLADEKRILDAVVRLSAIIRDAPSSSGRRHKHCRYSETRATFLKTYNGTRVVIPNSDMYTNAVVVKTAFDSIRSEYDIGVGCNESRNEAKRLILEAASRCVSVSGKAGLPDRGMCREKREP